MTNGFAKLKEECDRTVKHFKVELTRLRSGRATSSLLEGVTVDYYGSQVPLIQLGLINAPEPRLLTVQVYDQGAVEAVEKAIRQADLGFNPAREGGLIRINIPTLTEDRRKEMIKKIHKMAEETRVSVRNHRREELDGLKKKEKAKELSSDDLRRSEQEIQKIIDKFIAEVDTLSHAKEKEMLEV